MSANQTQLELTEAPDEQAPSLANRLIQRFRPGASSDARAKPRASFPPLPTQLALPLGDHRNATHDLGGSTPLNGPSLFREARRVGSVLSYEQASLDQIIPDTAPATGAPQDRLILPGGAGLVLLDGPNSDLAFDWIQWGETGQASPGSILESEATLDLRELAKPSRAMRKLASRRCVIPLTRYSVPVRDDEMWSHRWITPPGGQVACAAGILLVERGKKQRFIMIADDRDLAGDAPAGPLLLDEADILVWLRDPLKAALAQIAFRRAVQSG